MISVKNLREKTASRIVPKDKPGYYIWWAEKTEFDFILDALDVRYEDVCNDVLQKNGLYSIYLGIASHESIYQRVVKWHILQHHTFSNVRNKYLSTLRKTISSLISHNQLDEKGTNSFMDKLKVDYTAIDSDLGDEAEKKLHTIELESFSKNLYILNIQDNHYNELTDKIKRKLKKIRKEGKKNALSVKQ